MRTQDEILARYNERKADDMFGFEVFEYIEALEFDRARPFLKDDLDEEKVRSEWKPASTRDDVLAKMKDYMSFAFEKAHGKRGLSAGRSVAHYTAWTWLAGDDELSARIDRGDNYAPYGLPILRAICKHYGWDPSELGDDKLRTAEEEWADT